MAPNTPNALARSFGSVNITVMRESAAGASSAPNTPCSARAVNSSAAPPTTELRPPRADAAANPTSPMMRAFLRPM